MALTQVPNSMLAFDGGPLGMRNRIINGDMRIDQRNAGAAQTVTTASAYSIDRWKIFPVGASVTSQQVSSGITGTPYVLQITGAASVSNVYVFQRIEANNIADLAGKTVTLSFQTSNSLLTTVNWYANYANSVDNFSASTGIASGSVTVTSTLTSFSVNITLPSNVSNGLEITFFVAAQTSGTWKLTNVQLETGTFATPFERRPYGMELALCQRYYEKMNGAAIDIPANTSYSTNGIGGYCFPFKVTKRANPTLTGVTVSGVGMSLYTSATTVDFAKVSAYHGTAAGAVYGSIGFSATGDASAEL
jgi:hypothetical protein